MSFNGTEFEELSIFVEKVSYKELCSFDVVNMFPSIDNKMEIESVGNILLNRENDIPSAECIIEALKLCLNCNNSVFYNQHYLQVGGTAQCSHMSC